MTLLWWLACVPDGPFTADEWALISSMALPDELPLPTEGNTVADRDDAIALGEAYFVDADFSVVDGGVAVSCETCHSLCLGSDCEGPFDGGATGADLRGGAVSAGAAGSTARNSPSIVNTVFQPVWGWRGAFCDLKSQILFPFTSAGAYNAGDGTEAPAVVAPVALSDDHLARYVAVFGDPAAHTDATVYANVGFALEAFVRTLVVDDTPLDRLLAGDEAALTPAQIRGAKLFVTRGHCVACHAGPLLSDGQFHNVGIPDDDPGRGYVPTDGKTDFLCEAPDAPTSELGKFRTASLRGVAGTGPFMHDGSFRSLWEVIDHYNVGGQTDTLIGELDPLIRPLGLDEDDRDDLEQFLLALSAP